MQDKNSLKFDIQGYLNPTNGITVQLSLPLNLQSKQLFVKKNLQLEKICSIIMKKQGTSSNRFLYLEIGDHNSEEFVMSYIFSDHQLS